MKFKVDVYIMPLRGLLDPQGRSVNQALMQLGFEEISKVRVGKHITFEIIADTKELAMERVNEACNELLANSVTEGYEYNIKQIS